MNATIEKHLNILDYALSSLWRRRLKNGGIIVVFAAVIFLVASFQLVTGALTETAGRVLTATPEITIQRMSAGRQEAIPLVYGDRLQKIYGIRAIVPRVWGYYFDEVRGANYTVLGVAPGMPQGDELSGAVIGNTTWPPEPGRVVMGRAAAATLELQPGQLFSFFRPDLSLKAMTVAGVFRPETELLTADLIAMPLADARDLFVVPATQATDLCVYVANPAEIATIAEKISKILPDTRVLTRPQIQKTYQVVFGWRSGFASVCLLAALAAFAILAWDKASGLSPEERREIAILKILGWETSDVLALRFWEGGLAAGLAFLLGTTLAYFHVAFGGAALFKPVLVGWSVLQPALTLAPQVTLKEVLLLLAFTVLPYLAVTVIPAWRAASVPAESALSG